MSGSITLLQSRWFYFNIGFIPYILYVLQIFYSLFSCPPFFHRSGPVHTKPYLAACRRTLMHLMFGEELAPAPNSCSEKEKQEACDITSTHRRTQIRTHNELRPQLINFVLTVNNGAIFLFSLCLRGIFIFDFLIKHQIRQIAQGDRMFSLRLFYKRVYSHKRWLLGRKDRHGNSVLWF